MRMWVVELWSGNVRLDIAVGPMPLSSAIAYILKNSERDVEFRLRKVEVGDGEVDDAE